MSWIGALELKKLFINFFKEKEHLELKSFSLVPENDSSLLFINSGMAPMKSWFLNQNEAVSKRVVTVQKCLRTADLDLVGKTDRHGTFFEMLGNFSFGDYFKKEAIFWAFEFVSKYLKIPEEKFFVTVYEKDDEAFDIWNKGVGILKSHIVKLGKKDNFWEIGQGPCGPCSELYYDRGEKYGCKKQDCAPGCDCNRFIEFWNVVFSQYDKKEDGSYVELTRKNIDTGMGLERLAVVMQNANNLFEVDIIRNVLKKVCELSGQIYGKNLENDILIRIITDHIRSIVFLICDGVLPSNEGRGYVLRKLIRRAYNSANQLNAGAGFLKEISNAVFENNLTIANKVEYVKKILKIEEEAFCNILKFSESKLFSFFKDLKKTRIEDFLKNYDLYFKHVVLCLERFNEKILLLFNVIEKKEQSSFSLNSFYGKLKELKKAIEQIKSCEMLFFKETLKTEKILEQTLNCECLLQKILSYKSLNEIKKEEVVKSKEKFINYFKCYHDFIEKRKVSLKDDILKLLICDEVNCTDFNKILNIFKTSNEEMFFIKCDKNEISGDRAFKLCDTYGMPFEILNDIALKNGFSVDKAGFLKLLNKQREQSKKATKLKNKSWDEKDSKFGILPKTGFVGYSQLCCLAKVLVVLKTENNEGKEEVKIVFNKTPIYATSAGQQADKGVILNRDLTEQIGVILGCEKTKTGQFVHMVELFKPINEGDFVVVEVDKKRRKEISKNHTAAHILQKALVLKFKEGIFQAGQQVSKEKLRFDFTNFKEVSSEDLKEIEETVNNVILQGLDVVIKTTELKKAKEEGAIALFSKKYGDVVRVVEVLGFSKELCSGTHVKNTGEIGAFKIVAYSSIGTGIKRIEAITGVEILTALKEKEKLIKKICDVFKLKNYVDLEQRVKNIVLEAKSLREEIKEQRLKLCKVEFMKSLEKDVVAIKKLMAVVFKEEILEKNELKDFADYLKNRFSNLIVLIFARFKEKFNIAVVCSKSEILKNVDANCLVKKLAVLANGKGGGRKDFAIAGVENFNKQQQISDVFFKELQKILKDEVN